MSNGMVSEILELHIHSKNIHSDSCVTERLVRRRKTNSKSACHVGGIPSQHLRVSFLGRRRLLHFESIRCVAAQVLTCI